MKKEFKRETKIAIFTYGCIATIYIGILYVFSIFLFPKIFGFGEIFDIKTIALMIFVFVAGVIGIYKVTKEIKSDYIRAMAIFLIPTIIVLLFKDKISMAVILMLGMFMINGIYRVTPKVNGTCMKLLKLLAVVVVVFAVLLSIGLLVGQIMENNNNFREMAVAKVLENDIALVIAALLFMSFATKEVIKEVLAKYKPTDKEIGSLISGTVVLFFVMVAMTSAIQFTYNLNRPQVKEMGLTQTNFIVDENKVYIVDENTKMQNVVYDIFLGLFSLLILIEIYEEIRIVQMLKKEEVK